MLRRIENRLTFVIDRLGRYLNYVGAGVLAAMMLFTATDVGLRYFAGRPIKGSYELTSFMMAIVIAFALAFCALRKGHISVDVFIYRLPTRLRAVLSFVTQLITLGFLGLVTWQCIKYIFILHQANTLSTVLPIPHYPFVIGVSVGMAVFVLVVLRDLFDSLRQILGQDDGPA